MDIPKHLTRFGQEACPDWALERKVTERPAHGDTIPSPPRPGHARLVQSELAHPAVSCPLGVGPGAGTLDSARVSRTLLYKKMSPLVLALLGLGA